MEENTVCAHAIISGRVQGVFYRMETLRAVEAIGGVTGWVKNRSDGTVEAVFEGPRGRVEAVLAWCRNGPPRARVTAVTVSWHDPSGGHERFVITR
ncbi:MAG: acylphosphatase [Desulfobacteraceae bacterium]|nr:acylphosphatase [Desulfobacteraceae bacterium]